MAYAIAVSAMLVFASCRQEKAKFANKQDEIKQKYNLPEDAVLLKQFVTCGDRPDDHAWLLLSIGGDTVLFHRHEPNGNSDATVESMTRISWKDVPKNAPVDDAGKNELEE